MVGAYGPLPLRRTRLDSRRCKGRACPTLVGTGRDSGDGKPSPYGGTSSGGLGKAAGVDLSSGFVFRTDV
jgi:hypothetical protein